MALAALQARVGALNQQALVNGQADENVVQPARAFVPDWAKVCVGGAGAPRGLARQIRESHARAAAAAGVNVSTGAIVAMHVTRWTVGRMFAWGAAELTQAETIAVAPAAALAAPAQAEVDAALAALTPLVERLAGIVIYNAVSLAKCGHHHAPDDTGRLFETTVRLLDLSGIIGVNPDDVMAVYHHAGHVFAMQLKLAIARNPNAAEAASRLGFDNLALRIPVALPNTALLANFATLVGKAAGFPVGALLTDAAAPHVAVVAQHLAAINAAVNAREAAVHAAAVSAALGPAVAALCGVIAGGMGLRDVRVDRLARVVSVVRSPAISAACREDPGMMRMGFDVITNAPDPDQLVLVNALRAALSLAIPAVPAGWAAIADAPAIAPVDHAGAVALGAAEAKAEDG